MLAHPRNAAAAGFLSPRLCHISMTDTVVPASVITTRAATP
jgi:hypothetical protein